MLWVPSPQFQMSPELPDTFAKNWTSIPLVPEEAMLNVKLAVNAGQVETVSINVYAPPQLSVVVRVTAKVPEVA